MPFLSEPLLTPLGDDRWQLAADLVYRGDFETWTVPAGYVTDLATIPRVVAWLIPTYGRYTKAAIVHDYLITHEVDEARAAGRTWMDPRDVDGVFRRIMRELGVSAPRRWVMWAGVRWGSLFGGRATGWWRDAGRVLIISAAVAPVVVLGGVPVAAALAVWHVVEQVGAWMGDRNGGGPPNLTV